MKPTDEQIRELITSGLTQREVRDRLGCNTQTINDAVKRLGLSKYTRDGDCPRCPRCNKTIPPQGVAVTDGFYMCEYYGRH